MVWDGCGLLNTALCYEYMHLLSCVFDKIIQAKFPLSVFSSSGVRPWYLVIFVRVYLMMFWTYDHYEIGWAILYELYLSINVKMWRYPPVDGGVIDPMVSLLMICPAFCTCQFPELMFCVVSYLLRMLSM